MNWTELLKADVEGTYHATEGLLSMVDDGALGFKPESGDNWMTMGQLLQHLSWACGACMRGFVTGDWNVPDGEDAPETPEEEAPSPDALPSAEKMPTVETVAQAGELLAADKKLALEMIALAGEEDLGGREVAAPWNPEASFPLGHHLLQMVQHLAGHKAQLFYYLKLLGKPVHTGSLWGI